MLLYISAHPYEQIEVGLLFETCALNQRPEGAAISRGGRNADIPPDASEYHLLPL
jgi:hypothetical protein